MSTLAITAAHFIAIPIRYAVGRWYNIPTNTLLAFNAANLGLDLLGRTILRYSNVVKKWNLTDNQAIILTIALRTCAALSALYITSKLTDPMPIQCAVMTNIASAISIAALVAIANWCQKKMSNFIKGTF